MPPNENKKINKKIKKEIFFPKNLYEKKIIKNNERKTIIPQINNAKLKSKYAKSLKKFKVIGG